MNTPKEIANKIKQDAHTIQQLIKRSSGLDISTQELNKIADTLLNDCKTTGANAEIHAQLAINRTRQELDHIATHFEEQCHKKNIMDLAKQEVLLFVYKTKSDLKTTRPTLDAKHGHNGHTHGNEKNEKLTFGKELKQGKKQHGTHQSNPLNKEKMKGMFGISQKNSGKKGGTEHQQPRRK